MSTAVLAGYKPTEVGVIPEDWEVRPLLSAVRIANGQVDPRVDPYRSMTLVAPDHIEGKTGRLLNKCSAADQRAISGKYLFSEGDIIYSKIRPYLRKAILTDFSGLCSADMYPLKAMPDVDAGFMLPVLLGERFSGYAESVSVRSGMPKINRAELAEYAFALPPLPEQRAIATALNDLDALLSGLNSLTAKKQNLKQAAMQQLLTGQTRLPGFSGEWEVKRLGDVVEIKKGQLITEKTVVFGEVPVIAGGKKPAYFHNQPNRIGKTITVSASGASAGYVELFDRPIFASDCSTISEGKDYSIEFICFQMQLRQDAIYRAQTGGAQPHIHAVDLAPIEIGCPELVEQTAIATVLSDMDTELAALQARRDKTRSLKQGMMQELLTGSIRLLLIE